LADHIREARALLLAAELERTGTKPEYAKFDGDIKIDLGPILDALRCHSECCRGALMGLVDVRDAP
jgi:hypothetical protein